MARRRPKNFKIGTVGVYVVRGPRGDQRWYWQATVTIAGKRKTIWSGWATKPEAERAVAEARAALPDDLATLEAKARQEATTGLTVAALLERWVEDCRARPYIAKQTMYTYTGAAKNLTRLIGGYRLSEVSIIETQGYMNARHAEGVRLRTAWRELTFLRIAWRWGTAARLHEEPLHLPAKTSVKMEKVHAPRPTREQAWAVWDQLKTNGAPEWLVRVYLLGIVTGARTGELFAARVGDFDMESGTIRIGRDRDEGESTKTGARVVYLDDASVEVLRPYVEGREPDERFMGDRSRTTMSHVHHYLRTACRELGVPEHPLYGLRRSATDAYYEAGASPEEEAAALGHTADTAQRHYRRMGEDQARAAARKVALGARPGGAPEPEPEPEEGHEGDGKVIPIDRAKGRTG